MEALITANVLSVLVMIFYNLYRIDEISTRASLDNKLRVRSQLIHLALVNIIYLVVFIISVMVSLALLRSL